MSDKCIVRKMITICLHKLCLCDIMVRKSVTRRKTTVTKQKSCYVFFYLNEDHANPTEKNIGYELTIIQFVAVSSSSLTGHRHCHFIVTVSSLSLTVHPHCQFIVTDHRH